MAVRRLSFIQCCIVMVMLIHVGAAFAENGPSCSAPPYALNRADENYQYLRDPACCNDFWDPIKYMPLNASGSWYLSVGGEARERYEYFSNPNWGAGPPGSGYSLQRYTLSADLHMGEHFRLFSQLESSLEYGRVGGPRPIDKDELDFLQLLLDVKFSLDGNGSLVLRSGRQELEYGSGRIIDVREGPNVRQSFDGFRTMLNIGEIQVDAFLTRPVETKPFVFDDGTDNSQSLWGLYSVFPLPGIPKGNIDLYYVGYHNKDGSWDQKSGEETRHSIGTRLWRTAEPIDYNFEFIYQWGQFGEGDIQAWTAASDMGYTFGPLPFHPRLGLKADIISGDRNPNSPDLQTFNPLFPKGNYFSENGLIGPVNLVNVNPSFTLHFTDKLSLSPNWDFFWRESTHDGVYNGALLLVQPANNSTARYVGNQPQIELDWNIDRHIAFTAIYAHFFTGEFLRETGPAKDVDYVTTWITYKF